MIGLIRNRMTLSATPLAALMLLTSCFFGHDHDGHTCGTGFEVRASVASANLADDCGLRVATAGAPAAESDVSSRFACLTAGDAPVDGCGGYCRQSSMQLSLSASAGEGVAHVQIVRVRLIDKASGRAVATLPTRNAQLWNGSGYLAWNEIITAGESLKVSYDLGATDWAAIGGGNVWQTYSMTFQLEIELSIDGESRTLRSADLMREPEVVT